MTRGFLPPGHAPRRAAVALALAVGLTPAPARADWLFTPFIGRTFGGATTLADPDQAAGRSRLALGGSVMWLGEGPFGLEGGIGYTPRFFQRDPRGREVVVFRSGVLTLTGNLVVAVPRRITRDSLRPYGIAGLGLVRAHADTFRGATNFDTSLLGLSVGGGVIGPIGNWTSLRFDVRHVRSLEGEEIPGVTFGPASLTFWRAALGVTFHY